MYRQYTREIHTGIGFIEKGLPLVERLGRFDDVVYSKAIMGYMCSMAGDFRKGIATGHEALEVSQREGVLSFEPLAHMCIALSWMFNGQWDKAIECLTLSCDLCRNLEDHILENLGVAYLGYPMFIAGDPVSGLAHLERGIRGLEESGSGLHVSMCYGLLAELRALTNDDAGVCACVERIEALSESGHREGDVCALRATAMVAAQGRNADWAYAADTMDEAIAVAKRYKLKPEAAISEFRFAEILHKKGDLDGAREQLDRAEALFRDMGMDWWTEQAEGLRGRIDGGKEFVWFAPYVDGPPSV